MDEADADEAEVEHISQQIAGYLAANPQAADTLDGIIAWWLGRPVGAESRALVERALAKLADEGLIETRSSSAGGVLYRVRRRGDGG